MTDNKKPTNEEIKNEKAKNEELTDEQANEAAGGIRAESQFTCEGGCGRTYYGSSPVVVNGKKYCAHCFKRYIGKEEAGYMGRL